MEILTQKTNGQDVAVVRSDALILTDVQSALDLIGTVGFETGISRLAIYKEAISEDFFVLRTRLAGEILQKFINYGAKLAIIGDFSTYDSKSLRDFIYESNNGKDIFFVASVEEAVEKLSKA